MDEKELEELPGPWGFPVVGSLLSLMSFKERTLMQWAEEYYGPVFQIRLGTTNVVVLNGHEAMHEAMIKKAQAFAGRLDGPVYDAYRGSRGLFFKQYDEDWKKWRNVVHVGLEDLFGNVQTTVADESKHFREALDRISGEVDIYDHVLNALVNSIMQTCFSRRFEHDDPVLKDILHLAYEDIRNTKFQALAIMPWLCYVPSFKRYLDEMTINTNKLGEKIMQQCNGKDSETAANLAAHYSKVNECPSNEDRESLAFVLADLIQAGTTTSTAQFVWVILLLLKHPEAMRKAQEELDAVLCECENPVKSALGEKRQDLNFCRAIIEETLRMRPVAPVGLLHQTTEETSVMGYRVPKGTAVMPNIWSVHHDRHYWAPDPEVFRPERHLDQSGAFRKLGHVIPFGIGLRACAGPKVVETSLLAYVVSILWFYDITLSPSDDNLDLNGISTTLLHPPRYKVILDKRNR